MKLYLVGHQHQGRNEHRMVYDSYFSQDHVIQHPPVFKYRLYHMSCGIVKIEPLTIEQQLQLVEFDPCLIKLIKNPDKQTLLYVKLKSLTV